jgi:hypothetical protein
MLCNSQIFKAATHAESMRGQKLSIRNGVASYVLIVVDLSRRSKTAISRKRDTDDAVIAITAVGP